MKNKTKAIVSAVLTAAMTFSAIPYSASAEYDWRNDETIVSVIPTSYINSDTMVFNKNHIEGLTKVDDKYNFLPNILIHGTDSHRCTTNYTNEDGTEIISVEPLKHKMYFNLNDGATLDDVKTIIKGLKSEEGNTYTVSAQHTYTEDSNYEYVLDEDNGTFCQCGDEKGLTTAEVKEISNALKEKNLIADMFFNEEMYREFCYCTSYILTYHDRTMGTPDGAAYLIDVIEKDIEENNLPVYLSVDGPNDTHFERDGNGYFFLYPKEEMTLEEKMDVAEYLYQKFNRLLPEYFKSPKDAYDKYDPFRINLWDEYVEGDANLDGSENMADAVFVMQSLANPNKYEITEQGSFNADTDGNGLTNADALAIQKAILKLS